MSKLKSKVTKVRPVRLANDLDDRMLEEVERSKLTRKGEPLTVNAFIVAAIREKLAHMLRSRRKRRPKDGV